MCSLCVRCVFVAFRSRKKREPSRGNALETASKSETNTQREVPNSSDSARLNSNLAESEEFGTFWFCVSRAFRSRKTREPSRGNALKTASKSYEHTTNTGCVSRTNTFVVFVAFRSRKKREPSRGKALETASKSETNTQRTHSLCVRCVFVGCSFGVHALFVLCLFGVRSVFVRC